MIALLQRVKSASVDVEQQTIGKIQHGILVLLGVEPEDTAAKADRLAQRVCNYRLFSDEQGKMNLNVSQVKGAILVVSQFTLLADTKKGNRPGFSGAGDPGKGKILYERFTRQIAEQDVHCETGQFGADMQVSLVNDGPVTFWLQI